MIILAKTLLITLALLIISFIYGSAYSMLAGNKIGIKDGPILRVTTGFVIFMLVEMVICTVNGFGIMPFAGVKGVLAESGAAVALAVAVQFTSARKNNKNVLSGLFNHGLQSVGATTGTLVAVSVLIGVAQILMIEKYSLASNTAIKNVSIATYVYENGAYTIGSPIMGIWGTISYVLKVHPLVLIYTVLPAFLLFIYYAGYYELMKSVFKDDVRASVIGIIVVELLSFWGYQSKLLEPLTLLISWFGAVGFVVHGLLPNIATQLIYGLPEAKKADEKDTEAVISEEDDCYEEEWDMKKHKIINARNLAIAMGILTVMLIAFVFILNNKINSLHDSTANLQRDLDSRCSMYEFTTNSGKVEGYLMKGSDGSTTMIGGGSAENADALYSFLEEYGYSLTNWYLYDGEEENVGAYLVCTTEKGISVDNVYVLSRTQVK